MSFGRHRSSRQPQSSAFFRGKEFLALALFIAIAIVGWPILISQFRRTQQITQLAVPKVEPDPRPIKPDDSLPFQAIRDKTPNEFRELAAYSELLRRAREISAADLHAASRRDLLFTHFWERPAAYRGVATRLEGTMLRALTYEAKEELTPKKRLYEAWFITPESRRFPYVVVFEVPPPGFKLGDDLNEPIAVEGYFFKLLGYRAGDVPRAAPMLIGRISLPQASTAVAAGTPPANAPKPAWQNPAIVAIGGLVAYLVLRMGFTVRRFIRPRATGKIHYSELPPELPSPPSEEVVNNFLADLENKSSDEAPASPPE